MASTATITFSGTIATTPYGSETLSLTLTNSTSVGVNLLSTLASAGTSTNAPSFTPPADAKFVLIVPPATNGQVVKLGQSTSTVVDGFPLHPTNASFLSLGSTATTFYLWSTGAAQVNNISVSYY